MADPTDGARTAQTGATGGAAGLAPQTQQRDAVEVVIDRWFGDSFNGSRLANDTELWNLVHGAKERLKQLLAGR